MKKAFLHQMLLGWVALAASVIFIATISDERDAKNKYNSLEDLSREAIKALSRDYFRQMQGDLTNPNIETTTAICAAENLTDNLLSASDLGEELLDKDKISYVWRDTGSLDLSGNFIPGAGDGYPDTVSAVITNYEKENFWYRLLDKDNFQLPGFTRSIDLNNFNILTSVDFRGVINAGYFNMVGTYQLDDQGCPTNPKLILDNKKDWEDRIGETMEEINYPETKLFFIADGYRRFGNFNSSTNTNPTLSEDSPISFDNPAGGCEGNTSEFPVVEITTSTGQVQRSDHADVTGSNLTSRANVYFENEYLNFDDQSKHMDEIAEKDWGAFVAFTEPKYNSWSGEKIWNAEAEAYAATLTEDESNALANYTGDYEGWRNYIELKGLTPDFSPDNQYVFISEDLAATTNKDVAEDRHDKWNSDRDFTDMSFSMLKLYTPQPIDIENINDGKINITCD